MEWLADLMIRTSTLQILFRFSFRDKYRLRTSVRLLNKDEVNESASWRENCLTIERYSVKAMKMNLDNQQKTLSVIIKTGGTPI